MARLLFSTDVAIAVAIRANTLRVVTRTSRFGGEFIALEDDVGLIEVHLTQAEADARLAKIRAALQ